MVTYPISAHLCEGHQSPVPITQVNDSDGGVDLVKKEERAIEKNCTRPKDLGPIDIEHVYVEDGPRLWSKRKKKPNQMGRSNIIN
jgi:hypothetical protein